MENKKFEQNINPHDYVGTSRFKKFLHFIKIPLISICCLGVITGIVYPIVVTGVGQAVFNYEANGSLIKIKLKDGTVVTYGSKLIGQDFYTNNNGQYMFGRLDFGQEGKPQTDAEKAKKHFDDLLTKYNLKPTTPIPQELLTNSGSGVDPNISIEAAKWQADLIVAARTELKKTNPDTIVPTKEEIYSYINKYSDKQFVGIFGNNVTNVLLVNLAIDKKI
ncbi:potassium-transporting ATPase subunit C [Malacoplasma iowae]|uniref:Potassium-transporting ATPase subunit C n=1 Tax=Malacoplasma iowae 695 TaxID=1048830 RepID=A0A6P1LH00_MALIO|nr:potassium-transporting ATPase subunit C [Malacoplasma iowae]VEU62261.1 potassium-transporting ATPase subunit C [Mycoplasmopsis fermentans]EGZ31244.1 potassium-transporting ATPase subunit C [Malacoplasma iowae 695]QHG89890.1 potassium-transporting ATPase subunit C [Malacoplasma iowae 695]WPL35298.1 potassium-transporting ATPase subunit C [Malacoplasma iowae]VEU72477.1 potassium-transporting ATPase subunit C [Malacoplasma iowae]